MKFFIGGNIDSGLYEVFRVNRNTVHSRLSESIDRQAVEVSLKELSVHIFIRDDMSAGEINVNYNKRHRRAEAEYVIDFNIFSDSDDCGRQALIENAVRDSIIRLYENKLISAEDFAGLTKWIESLLAVNLQK